LFVVSFFLFVVSSFAFGLVSLPMAQSSNYELLPVFVSLQFSRFCLDLIVQHSGFCFTGS
jgi:hypothetical protein